jgi:hypothetical protein
MNAPTWIHWLGRRTRLPALGAALLIAFLAASPAQAGIKWGEWSFQQVEEPVRYSVTLDSDMPAWDLCWSEHTDAARDMIVDRIVEPMTDPSRLYVVQFDNIRPHMVWGKRADLRLRNKDGKDIYGEKAKYWEIPFASTDYEDEIELMLIDLVERVRVKRPGYLFTFEEFHPDGVRRGARYYNLAESLDFFMGADLPRRLRGERMAFVASKQFNRRAISNVHELGGWFLHHPGGQWWLINAGETPLDYQAMIAEAVAEAEAASNEGDPQSEETEEVAQDEENERPAAGGGSGKPRITVYAMMTGWSHKDGDWETYLYDRLAAADVPFQANNRILYDHQIGRLPRVIRNDDGSVRVRDGGVPQKVDLQKHLNRIDKPLRWEFIDETFDGWIVVNWEGTWPLFETASRHTQDYALAYSRQQYKHLRSNYDRLLQQTADDYDYWYRQIAEPLLKRIRATAPKAKLAIWAYPRPTASTEEQLERQEWLIDLLDAYAPCFYFGRDVVDDRRPRRPREESTPVREASLDARITPFMNLTGTFDKPIIPFANVKFGPRTFRYNEWVRDDEDMRAVWLHPVEKHDVNQFFLWHAVRNKEEADELADYIINFLVPWLEQHFELVTYPSAAAGLRKAN